MNSLNRIIHLVVSIIVFFGVAPARLMAEVTITLSPTSSMVLPGGARRIYPLVQGDSNTTVQWSANGGLLNVADGYVTWTAPDTPGSYSVSAKSMADPKQFATTQLTVVKANIRISNIPMQLTAFKDQPVVIQSILWGTTDTSVKWSTSGGELFGNGREVVFKSTVPGHFTVTATSVADNSKSATTTIVVTEKSWPKTSTPNRTMPVDCTATGAGNTYNVTSDAEMDSVPWSRLSSGDTVRIHPGVYHRQIALSSSGTASQPIRICGVADKAGKLPELNGLQSKAVPASLYGRGGGNLQGAAGVLIYRYDAPYWGGATYPQHIIIEGLKISGFNKDNSFTDVTSGQVKPFGKATAAIRVQHGAHITLRGNDISQCGNGIFSMSKDGIESRITRNLLIEGNYFHDNGVAGDFREHQNYLQVFGLVVQGNYYDLPLMSSPGGQLKSRSIQQFVRYNYFEPAARMLDLVEVQDATPLVFPWVGLPEKELKNTSAQDVIANFEAYQDQFVYGNILHNTGSRVTAWMVHGTADTGSQDFNPGGYLYFYYNTVFHGVSSKQNYRSGLIDFGPYQSPIGRNSVWPIALITNNAIYLDAKVKPTPTFFLWNRYISDRVMLERNWISSTWGTGNPQGGYGTGISNQRSNNLMAVWQGGQNATQVKGVNHLVTGALLPFDLKSFEPDINSQLISASVQLSGQARQLPPLMEYNIAARIMVQRLHIRDLGAISGK